MKQPTPRRPWWRRLLLSVRGLMTLILIVGSPVAWLIGSVRSQRNAIVAIRAVSGTVVYYDWDWNEEGRHLDPLKAPRWRTWLAAQIGADYVGHIVAVEFGRLPIERNDRELTDAAMVGLSKLDRIRMLNISDCRDRDAQLAGLKHLTSLTKLSMRGAGLTDYSVLNGMTNLRELHLSASSVGDDDLADLGKLPRLRSLSLDVNEITDGGLAHLKGAPELAHLFLDHTKITDSGLVHLRAIKHLEFITLDGTRVTDAGLAHLEGLDRLEGLSLHETKVTDAGLVHLKRLSGLRRLYLQYTAVTDAGIQSLKDALPLLSAWR